MKPTQNQQPPNPGKTLVTSNQLQGKHRFAKHTVTTIHRVETDKVKPDQQHREHRWIDKTEDDLHPYIKEMIENTSLFR